MSSVVQESDKRKKLNRELWQACFKDCGKMNDDQSVEWKREGACLLVTQRTRVTSSTNNYKELTISELEAAIKFIRMGAGVLDKLKPIKDSNTGKYMTKAQSKKLHRLAQECAVFYAPCDVVVQCGDLELTGDELRAEMTRAFCKGQLTGYIQKHIYSKWINPKIHEFLKSSGLRYQVRDARNTYYVKWDEITREEADALIIRFQKIINEIQERYTPVKPLNPSLN